MKKFRKFQIVIITFILILLFSFCCYRFFLYPSVIVKKAFTNTTRAIISPAISDYLLSSETNTTTTFMISPNKLYSDQIDSNFSKKLSGVNLKLSIADTTKELNGDLQLTYLTFLLGTGTYSISDDTISCQIPNLSDTPYTVDCNHFRDYFFDIENEHYQDYISSLPEQFHLITLKNGFNNCKILINEIIQQLFQNASIERNGNEYTITFSKELTNKLKNLVGTINSTLQASFGSNLENNQSLQHLLSFIENCDDISSHLTITDDQKIENMTIICTSNKYELTTTFHFSYNEDISHCEINSKIIDHTSSKLILEQQLSFQFGIEDEKKENVNIFSITDQFGNNLSIKYLVPESSIDQKPYTLYLRDITYSSKDNQMSYSFSLTINIDNLSIPK